jgi:hypothetical protein
VPGGIVGNGVFAFLSLDGIAGSDLIGSHWGRGYPRHAGRQLQFPTWSVRWQAAPPSQAGSSNPSQWTCHRGQLVRCRIVPTVTIRSTVRVQWLGVVHLVRFVIGLFDLLKEWDDCLLERAVQSLQFLCEGCLLCFDGFVAR